MHSECNYVAYHGLHDKAFEWYPIVRIFFAVVELEIIMEYQTTLHVWWHSYSHCRCTWGLFCSWMLMNTFSKDGHYYLCHRYIQQHHILHQQSEVHNGRITNARKEDSRNHSAWLFAWVVASPLGAGRTRRWTLEDPWGSNGHRTHIVDCHFYLCHSSVLPLRSPDDEHPNYIVQNAKHLPRIPRSMSF